MYICMYTCIHTHEARDAGRCVCGDSFARISRRSCAQTRGQHARGGMNVCVCGIYKHLCVCAQTNKHARGGMNVCVCGIYMHLCVCAQDNTHEAVCIYAYIHEGYMHACMHARTHAYTDTINTQVDNLDLYVHRYVHIYICMYVCAYVCLCICIHRHLCIYICLCIHTSMYVYVYIGRQPRPQKRGGQGRGAWGGEAHSSQPCWGHAANPLCPDDCLVPGRTMVGLASASPGGAAMASAAAQAAGRACGDCGVSGDSR